MPRPTALSESSREPRRASRPAHPNRMRKRVPHPIEWYSLSSSGLFGWGMWEARELKANDWVLAEMGKRGYQRG